MNISPAASSFHSFVYLVSTFVIFFPITILRLFLSFLKSNCFVILMYQPAFVGLCICVIMCGLIDIGIGSIA